MSLEEPNRSLVEIGLVKELSDELGLRISAWYRDPRSASILIGAGAADNRPNGVSITDCIINTLHSQDGVALATAVSVGTVVETVRAAVSPQEVTIAKELHETGMKQKIGASDKCL